MEEYKIMINEFEGPLDLLLHLIKKSDIDILDIRIDEITTQYLNYLNSMKKLDLDIASEYLVLASELLEIKSWSLLPKKEVLEEQDDEEDPRQNLINRLVEYQKYKEIASKFKFLELDRKQYYTKEVGDLKQFRTSDEVILKDVELGKLIDAFSNFLERKKNDKPIHTKITKKEYSIEKRCSEIKQLLIEKKVLFFEELFDCCNKEYIVVNFLSILNLAKSQELVITQKENFEKITLKLKGWE